jgi:hypothetical protein
MHFADTVLDSPTLAPEHLRKCFLSRHIPVSSTSHVHRAHRLGWGPLLTVWSLHTGSREAFGYLLISPCWPMELPEESDSLRGLLLGRLWLPLIPKGPRAFVNWFWFRCWGARNPSRPTNIGPRRISYPSGSSFGEFGVGGRLGQCRPCEEPVRHCLSQRSMFFKEVCRWTHQIV